MKIIQFTKGNISLRHSIIRLGGCEHLSPTVINAVLRNEMKIGWSDAQLIHQADRCASFIEGVKRHRIELDSEDYIITLATLYPHNMMEESYLRTEFAQELVPLRKLLRDNLANNVPILTSAKKVLKLISDRRLIKHNTLAVMFLICNLLIVHSNHIIILEDTDEVDAGILLAMTMEVERRA